MTKDATKILQATAIGDSLGLPWEGLRPQPTRTDWNQCFLGNRGITSDDTQHAVITLQSLRESQGDHKKFRQILGRRLAIWFLCLPPGIGLATLRASLKLCLGLRAPHSGVWSAGNGPAMRAPILGWELWDQSERLKQFTQISTETTHTDPKALIGANALAQTVAALRAGKTEDEIIQMWLDASDDALWQEMIQKAVAIQSAQDFLQATNQKKGVGGFIFHTVPTAFHVWLHHRESFEEAITTSLQMGGDADSSTAIVGALAAASGLTPPEKWGKVLDMPTEETKQSGFRQLGLNMLTTLLIISVHIPQRTWQRLRATGQPPI